MFTGSEAKPTAATTIRNASRRGSSRSKGRASSSRDDSRGAFSCGRGRVITRAATKTRYEPALSRNEAGMPRYSTDAAAATGPAARAMLYVIELSAIAVGSSCGSTSEATSACCDGIDVALVTPSPSATTITTHARASPAHASAASSTARTAAIVCATNSSRRRS